jgi:hypothetical protein
VTDSTGTVSIAPSGAKIDATMLAQRPLERSDFGVGGTLGTLLKGVTSMLSDPQRIRVWGIRPGQEVYVLGNVSNQGDKLLIGSGDGDFFVSTQSEEQLTRSLGWQAPLFRVVGVALIIGGIVCAVMKLV